MSLIGPPTLLYVQVETLATSTAISLLKISQSRSHHDIAVAVPRTGECLWPLLGLSRRLTQQIMHSTMACDTQSSKLGPEYHGSRGGLHADQF